MHCSGLRKLRELLIEWLGGAVNWGMAIVNWGNFKFIWGCDEDIWDWRASCTKIPPREISRRANWFFFRFPTIGDTLLFQLILWPPAILQVADR
jgi:hypothetical protein